LAEPDRFTVILTGGVAAGKSAVAKRFARLGPQVIDTDGLAREAVRPGQPELEQLVAVFGSGVLRPDGELDRAAMRSRVFADDNERQRLEAILHPVIERLARQRLSQGDSDYSILVVPLYVETGTFRWADRVLVVDVPEAIQVQRLMRRDLIDERQARAMLRAQATREQRLAVADDVIDNTGAAADLDNAVQRLHRQYLNLAGA